LGKAKEYEGRLSQRIGVLGRIGSNTTDRAIEEGAKKDLRRKNNLRHGVRTQQNSERYGTGDQGGEGRHTKKILG